MNSCVQCGSPIPEGQQTCSMCYGDIDHGSDGYYRRWAEEQERDEAPDHAAWWTEDGQDESPDGESKPDD